MSRQRNFIDIAQGLADSLTFMLAEEQGQIKFSNQEYRAQLQAAERRLAEYRERVSGMQRDHLKLLPGGRING